MGSGETSLGGGEGWGLGDEPVGGQRGGITDHLPGEGAGWRWKDSDGSPQEGVCILTGLGFNGFFDEYGTAKWDACANMKVWLFETNPASRAPLLLSTSTPTPGCPGKCPRQGCVTISSPFPLQADPSRHSPPPAMPTLVPTQSPKNIPIMFP